MITFNPDKFGFYRVGDKTTYSKFEAIEIATKNGLEVEWDFNNNVFGSIDWTKEPDTDLWEMYKQRARQIRDAYDYVVLWYSGGSDSHNILMAWLDAGLKIDEIATTMNYSATGDYQNHYNAEITNVVIPDVKRLQAAGYDFKFRIVDIAQFCIDVFEEYGQDFEYNINFHFSPNNPSRSIFRRKIDDYKNLIAEGKKLCFVWGKEKPTLLMDNGVSYFSFTDNVDDCVSPYTQRNYYQGWYDEFFYWTPDFPLIPVKQAHVVNNFIKYCDDETLFEPLVSDLFQSNGISKRFKKHLRVEQLKTIIYPKWSIETFCNGKTPSYTYSLRDEWFFRSNLELKKRFIDITNDYFKVSNPTNPRNRKCVLPRYSPKYRIE